MQDFLWIHITFQFMMCPRTHLTTTKLRSVFDASAYTRMVVLLNYTLLESDPNLYLLLISTQRQFRYHQDCHKTSYFCGKGLPFPGDRCVLSPG